MQERPEDHVRGVTGSSKESFEDALNDAATAAYALVGEEATFDVLRFQVVIGNPRVNEYKVVLLPSSG